LKIVMTTRQNVMTTRRKGLPFLAKKAGNLSVSKALY